MRGVKIAAPLGVPFHFTGRAVAATLVLWLILVLLGWLWLEVSWGMAFIFGLTATVLHWGSELAHQCGHAWVARYVGFPMRGMRSWYVLIAAFYPRNEPQLPPLTHIKRAIGGPVVSLTLALLGLFLWIYQPAAGIGEGLIRFFTLENFFVFFLMALLPLGFTDGSTLLKWVPLWLAERQDRS